MPTKRKRKDKTKRKKKRRTEASRADRHELYQQSVQSPEPDIEFFERAFRDRRRRKPWSMREDFCGTAYLSTEWARSHPRRTALGVDLDAPTLDWGREHNLDPAGAKVANRVELAHADVLEVTEPKVDVTCALNFSFCIFKERSQLRDYFRVAYDGLGDDGIFITELYGGTEAVIATEDEREVEDFTYVWDQESFDPLSHHTVCHIHFEFDDGSRLDRAFTYDWRLWTVPEVRDLLLEVGFERVDLYWEDVDDDGEGSGEYRLADEEENQEGWIVYIVASK